ncbi:MAG: hypothetical protein WC975_09695 [Phycisphaerae bacterium]
MTDRVKVWLVAVLLVIAMVLPGGCSANTLLQDANAVQLEASLLTMMDGLLKTVVYNAMNLPSSGYTGL